MTIENIFRASQEELKPMLYKSLKKLGYKPVKKDGFVFAQGVAPVMLVAHLDTVHKERVKTICYSGDRNIMMSPEGIGGDDRCGVYMIMEIVKKIKCSVLFCEDEEVGAVGARKFVSSNVIPKNINYIVEIDREGFNDAVFYDCENPEFTDFVLHAGFKEEMGSFSDISEIAPALGVAAVNISSGYYNAHTKHEYVNLEEVRHNIYRISKMISTKSQEFEYIESQYMGRGFGRVSTPYGMGFCSTTSMCEVKDLMLITDDVGYVIDHTGKEETWEEFYLDSFDNLYIFDWDMGIAYETLDYQVIGHQGIPVRFRPSLAEPVNILACA